MSLVLKIKLTTISEVHAARRQVSLMSNCQLVLFSLESNLVKSSSKVMLAVTALPRMSRCVTEAFVIMIPVLHGHWVDFHDRSLV